MEDEDAPPVHKVEGSPCYGTFAPAHKPRADAPPPTRSALVKSASWFSRLFFLWFEYLVDISRTRSVRPDDVWLLDEKDRSAATYDLFISRIKRSRDWLFVAAQLYRWQILKSGVLSLVEALAGIGKPWLMYVVIAAVTNDKTSMLFIVSILVIHQLVNIVGKLAQAHRGDIMASVASRTVGALQTLLFDATISSTWSPSVTISETSNLFYELRTVHTLITTLHGLWVVPLSMIANLALLYYIIGGAAEGSIIATAILLAASFTFKKFNKMIAKRVHILQERRLQAMSECFKTIQSIKLHAWESRFLEKIYSQRRKERFIAHKMHVLDAVWRSVLTVLPEVILASSFVVLVKTHGGYSFNPAMAFASLSTLYRLKRHFGDIQWQLFLVVSSGVALKQVFSFVDSCQRRGSDESSPTKSNNASCEGAKLDSGSDAHCHRPAYALRFDNAMIGHTNEEPLLVMVNLVVPAGSLTVIHGATGVGKSSLLEAIVDSDLIINSGRGSILSRGRVAYCSQHPWLQSLSIRENILFGLPYDEEKYLNVLHACSLIRDIDALRNGDATRIGPKGLALSGGQKARIALARACYADADIYLLDSPLASVDAIVQSDIFRRCFVNLLRDKTILVVTHNVEVVSSPYVDQVVLLKDSRLILERNSYQREGEMQSDRKRLIEKAHPIGRSVKYHPSRHPSVSSRAGTLLLANMKSTRVEEQWRRIKLKMVKANELSTNHSAKISSSPLESARSYIVLCGGIRGFILPLAVLLGISRGFLIAAHLWICAWSARIVVDETQQKGMQNVKIYVFLVGVSSFVAFTAPLFAFWRCDAAADTLFKRMVRGVLLAPMSFFYDQPIGEIMNRFSSDVQDVDDEMAFTTLESVFNGVAAVMPWFVLLYILPEMLLVAPVLVWLVHKNRYQVKIALESLNLVASSFTPCFEAISEAIDGRHVIQAFGAGHLARFRSEHHRNLDQLMQMDHMHCVMRWWGVLQFFKADIFFLLVIIVAVVVRRDSLIPLFGLALHYVTTTNYDVFGFYQTALSFFAGSVKLQRVEEYGAIPKEHGNEIRQNGIVSDWPSRGEIRFEKVCFQYDEVVGPVIKGVELYILAGEKIGIVGRTGAGKSSLTMALFRIHELVSGRILIDGIDISLMDIYTLRSRLSIVPQSPLFFSGPLRSYLDPFDNYNDVALWEVLRKTGLSNVVSRLDGKLLSKLHDNAENLSLGERQLLCLSRVLLKRSRVVILDEATAAVDHNTDEILQCVLRSEFKDSTLLSIAHRLDSILEFDRVVVMDDGRIIQSGRVEELVADVNGPFFDLLEGALLQM